MSPTELNNYLTSLNLPQTTENKIRGTLSFYRDNDLLQPSALFISQDKDSDNNIRATSLWMFNSGSIAEADITNGKISTDLVNITNQILRYEIVASDSDFDENELTKYLYITANLSNNLICKMQAYGVNRKVLWDFFKENIKPNIAKPR